MLIPRPIILLAALASIVLNSWQSPLVFADAQCHFCKKHCADCDVQTVTVRCPTKVIETQLKSCVVEEMKEREETYTVFKRVPVTEKITKQRCYLADEIVSKEITETECHRVKNPVTRTFAVNVPVQEIHEGTRTRQVCGKCGEVCCIEEPCQCMLTRMHQEMDVEECYRDDVVFEKTKRTIDYCKKVPKIKDEFCAEEVTMKLVPVEKTRKVQVCVPKIEKQPVDVVVTKMLPYQVCCCHACAELRAKQQEAEPREHKLLAHKDTKPVLKHDHNLKEQVQKKVEKKKAAVEQHKQLRKGSKAHNFFEAVTTPKHGAGENCDQCQQ